MNDDATVGCFLIVTLLLSMAWIGFLIWAGIHIVNWLVTK